ncbi:Lipoprotein signal peptidase [Olavius algarvensis spirochete endosymbiont]|uniref:signal peptidase II n=1 Tax=Olavius algarvensis spirochete endosymbiont TaxID=260710 RepID=UPI00052CA014|nr:signal peptidase II [Olavius algarvensis spirochete endosymbiont]KGM38364.1 signal peptidase [Alkalispirochaeta odontotermitis]VDB00893.1 Lipoprotein signal peptidase [Olavius algarvensis spirochete endosymbiont]
MKKGRYFILSVSIAIIDQLSKFLVVKLIPPFTIAWTFAGDFFRLVHVRNTGAAFSMGANIPGAYRTVILVVIPVIVLIGMGIYLVRGKELPKSQRWMLAGILGGGIGNQFDRIFRSEGVVDFLDFKFFGIFGLERWPTFNIADASMVVFSIVLIILLFRQKDQGGRLE